MDAPTLPQLPQAHKAENIVGLGSVFRNRTSGRDNIFSHAQQPDLPCLESAEELVPHGEEALAANKETWTPGYVGNSPRHRLSACVAYIRPLPR
jgi:hypothetical protein